MSKPELVEYLKTELGRRYLSLVRDAQDEKKASSAFIKTLSSEEKDRAEELYKQCSFTRRRYPGIFYCWPHHKVFDRAGIDPWPAANYPKAVLMTDLLLRDVAIHNLEAIK